MKVTVAGKCDECSNDVSVELDVGPMRETERIIARCHRCNAVVYLRKAE